MAEWATDEIERESRTRDLVRAEGAELPRVSEFAPALAEAMAARPFQQVGARFAADNRRVLIADEPGLGKTLESLGAVVESGAKHVLIFSRLKAAETVWLPEIIRWIGPEARVWEACLGDKRIRDRTLAIYGAWRDSREEHPGVDFVICNIEMARVEKGKEPKFPQIFATVWDAIIVDESHNSLPGKNSMAKGVTQTRFGMTRLRTSKNALRIALSGTPFRGRLHNIWGTMNWLEPRKFSSLWGMVDEFFEKNVDSYGGVDIGGIREDRKEAFDRFLAPHMLRRTKAEVAPDMPPRQYGGTLLSPGDDKSTIGVWLPMEGKQLKGYQNALDGFIEADGGGEMPINGVLAERTRLTQFAVCNWSIGASHGLQPARPSNKLEWLVEFAREREGKIVVASQFTKVLNFFSGGLAVDGIKSYLLTGETKQDRISEIVDKFNDPNDSVQIMLLNTRAGGESINLDGVADDVVFLDETVIPEEQEQVENRIHRLSRRHQVRVWYVRSLGSIEEGICRITGAREGAIKERLDGPRGVDIIRRAIHE